MVDTLGTLKSGIGLGSGLDIESLVSNLITAEGEFKTERLNDDESETLAKITGFGNLKSALSGVKDTLSVLKDADQFQGRTATVTTDTASATPEAEFFTATASSTAAIASYEIEVQSLAKAHKLQTSSVFATEDAVLGHGTINLTVGAGGSSTKTYNITIDEDNKTLAGVRNTINARTSSTGVSATIITTDAGKRLVLTTDTPGEDYKINIEVDDNDGNDTDGSGLSQLVYVDGGQQNMTELTEASDATVLIDGQLVTTSSNKLVDTIDGVSIDLLKAEVGAVHTLNVLSNPGDTRTKIENFVNAYNDTIDLINDLTRFNPTDSEGNGDLFGDATVRLIDDVLRNGISNIIDVPTQVQSLSQIGITSDSRTGELLVDDVKLDNALNNKFADVSKMFSANDLLERDSGMAVQLFDRLDSILATDGALSIKSENLNDDLIRISEERTELNRKLADLEVDLTLKFSTLDALLGKFQQQTSQLAQQLTNFVDPLTFRK